VITRAWRYGLLDHQYTEREKRRRQGKGKKKRESGGKAELDRVRMFVDREKGARPRRVHQEIKGREGGGSGQG